MDDLSFYTIYSLSSLIPSSLKGVGNLIYQYTECSICFLSDRNFLKNLSEFQIKKLIGELLRLYQMSIKLPNFPIRRLD